MKGKECVKHHFHEITLYIKHKCGAVELGEEVEFKCCNCEETVKRDVYGNLPPGFGFVGKPEGLYSHYSLAGRTK